MSAVAPWPAALSGTPAVAVIERAIERKRLSHSLLLQGDDIDTLTTIALAIADRLLSHSSKVTDHHFPPEQHPDCFFLRPAGKVRNISADATRELIGKVQVTAAVSMRKVAIIIEADRMHLTAANIFLKTLEEPPANTTILLVTTRPYALLPTIRSRTLHFRFPNLPSEASAKEGWPVWLDDYRAWLARLAAGVGDKKTLSDHVFSIYGLVARFSAILDAATEVIWKQQKEKLPPEIEEPEQIAIEAGIAHGLRARFLAQIAQATRDHALGAVAGRPEAGGQKPDAGTQNPKLKTQNPKPVPSGFQSLVAAIERLEHNAGLLRLNLNESAALEDFLLCSLRLWTKR